MQLDDLIRSIPALALVGIAPGYLLASLLAPRWRWWERLAGAPGLSAGAVGITGLAFRHAHIGLRPATLAPLGVGLCAAVVWRALRPAKQRDRHLAGRSPAIALATALAAGLASAAALAFAFHDQALPVESDAPVHGAVAAAIAREGDVLPVIPVPVDHSASVRTRTGFEASAALVSELGGPEAARAMMPLTLLAVALLPLSLAFLALETTGSVALAALAAPLGAGMLFPAAPVLFGEFPLVVDSTLVVTIIVGALRTLRSPRLRDSIPLLTAAIAAVWVVHGTEALTALAVGGPLLIHVAMRTGIRTSARRITAGLTACLTGAALVTVLTSAPAVPPVTLSPLAGPVQTTRTAFESSIGHLGAAGALTTFRDAMLPHALGLLLYGLGLVAALATRRLWWALVAHVILLGAYLDVVVTGRLSRVWVITYPWSTDDRLLSIQYWVLPLIMAGGVVWIVELMQASRLADTVGRAGRLPLTRLGLAGALMATLTVLVGGTRSTALTYHDQVNSRAVVRQADLEAIRAMSARLPHGAIVASNGADAGQWVDVLTSDYLFFSKEHIQEYRGDRRLDLLDDACRKGTAIAHGAALFTGIDAVFVGTYQPDDYSHHWSAECLASIPWLRPVAWSRTAGQEAVAFMVVPGPDTVATKGADRTLVP
jgi:hypothetical protein